MINEIKVTVNFISIISYLLTIHTSYKKIELIKGIRTMFPGLSLRGGKDMIEYYLGGGRSNKHLHEIFSQYQNGNADTYLGESLGDILQRAMTGDNQSAELDFGFPMFIISTSKDGKDMWHFRDTEAQAKKIAEIMAEDHKTTVYISKVINHTALERIETFKVKFRV